MFFLLSTRTAVSSTEPFASVLESFNSPRPPLTTFQGILQTPFFNSDAFARLPLAKAFW